MADFTVIAENQLAVVEGDEGTVGGGSKDPSPDDALELDVSNALKRHSGDGRCVTCLACSSPKKGSVWCEIHKRVYECIYRQATVLV